MAGKDDDDDDRRRRAPAPVTSGSRGDLLVLSVVASLLTLSLAYFFYHHRILLHPRRFPRWSVLDAERKDDERGPGLEAWELLLCASVPALVWRCHSRRSRFCFRHLSRLRSRARTHVRMAVFLTALAFLGVRQLLVVLLLSSSLWAIPDCTAGWMETDVGYIRGHRDAARMGVSMRTLCSGRPWEPHVARAIDRHLYGQGRALDVGAFVGYHTVHLAKRAAPFGVVAFDGRISPDLRPNVQRNNAQNVRVVEATIDASWALDADLERDLLGDDDASSPAGGEGGPVVFAKIDCEGCELNFLRGARSVFEKFHPVIVVEVQDNASRRNAKVGGQQMVKSTDTREDVLEYLQKELGYTHVEALEDEDGNETWDYLAYRVE